MTPRRMRSVVPSDSGIGGERKPLTPEVEPILGGEGERATGAESPAQEVPEVRSAEVPDSRTAGDPKWVTLERKEARLRADQLSDLAELRRHVSARRRDRSEIITDNTLIRVAVDLLLRGHAHRLRGDTEEDLLHSVLPKRRGAQAQEEAGQEGAGRD